MSESVCGVKGVRRVKLSVMTLNPLNFLTALYKVVSLESLDTVGSDRISEESEDEALSDMSLFCENCGGGRRGVSSQLWRESRGSMTQSGHHAAPFKKKNARFWTKCDSIDARCMQYRQ